ncbi:peptide ABC transporter substrate-binding protein [Candidatus Parcubacteria bacterium]|nr:MAG: peptide ABC transporter substrate-binding protein [Candidatus Parcubacteria bacterium]
MLNLFRKKKNGFSNPENNNSSSTDWQNGLDKKLVSSLSKKRIPNLSQLKHLKKIISKKELWLIRICFLIIVASVGFLGLGFYLGNFRPVPITGGTYTEALVGAPQYINPLLAQTNDVDRDISRLVFSGLLKYDKNLSLVPDLASDYKISDDQKTYTFNLKKNIKWHDGTPFTVDDVIFTVQSIMDPDFRSPLLSAFKGVTVSKINDEQIAFILPEPFPSFVEALNFGILPEHIWQDVPPINATLNEYNIKPVGTGPWKFKKLSKDNFGNIKSYTLERNETYYGKQPYLSEINFKFYQDFDSAVSALKNKIVEGISYLPKRLKKELSASTGINYNSFSLPQYTAVFFNQKQNEFLKEKDVRLSLSMAVDKTKILSDALHLEGEIIGGPIPADFPGYNPALEKIAYNQEQAAAALDTAGWKRINQEEYKQLMLEEFNKMKTAEAKEKPEAELTEEEKKSAEESLKNEQEEYIAVKFNPSQEFYRVKDGKILEITLTTVDQSENVKAAELIAGFWEKIGVKTVLELVSSSKISRETIKTRNYQALLYGEILGADPDPFPFWHSSQSQDPGLNLAVFSNRHVDDILEEARTTNDLQKKHELYSQFEKIIVTEIPAIFLYNPTYTYVIGKNIKGIDISRIIVPSDRFNNLDGWYVKTKMKYKKS